MEVDENRESDSMTRRDAAWMIARALATPAGLALASGWPGAAQNAGGGAMRHSNAPPERDRWKDYRPKFFTIAQFGALRMFTQVLIPTDETPGAREAHVPEFIDFVLNAAAEYAPEMQPQWQKAADYLDSVGFAGMNAANQEALVAEMAAPETDPNKTHAGFPFYRLMKEMTVRAYYTSRAGLVENLGYQGYAYLTEFPGCNHPEHHKV